MCWYMKYKWQIDNYTNANDSDNLSRIYTLWSIQMLRNGWTATDGHWRRIHVLCIGHRSQFLCIPMIYKARGENKSRERGWGLKFYASGLDDGRPTGTRIHLNNTLEKWHIVKCKRWDRLMEIYWPSLFQLLQLEDPIPSNLIRLQTNNNTENFLYLYISPS